MRSHSLLTLVLCGMVMSALLQALISLVKYNADPVDTLATITFWLMGSLAEANTADAATVAIPTLLGGAILFALRRRIALLALGDHEAAALGADVTRLRILVILCATAMTAATVCTAGIVGWVGLLMPDIAHMAFGMEPQPERPIRNISRGHGHWSAAPYTDERLPTRSELMNEGAVASFIRRWGRSAPRLLFAPRFRPSI